MRRFSLLLLAVLVVAVPTLTGCPKPQTQPEVKVPVGTSAVPAADQEPTFSDAVTTVDDFAPDFALTDTEGNEVTKADYSGKVLVMDIWSTTCSSCVKKLDEYLPLYEQYKDQGVEWLAVSMDAKPEVASAGVAKHKWPYRVAMFNDELKQAYFADEAVMTIPMVRIIDRDGNLRYAFSAASTLQDMELALKELAEETVGGDEPAGEDDAAEEPAASAEAPEGGKPAE